ncbi:MAG: type II toxin-antitoxin system VapC family toxin [Chloroflexi bacterium]|nr:type II toxin-antitoxin system VapC family toxin [Chloroflexota bacterium]
MNGNVLLDTNIVVALFARDEAVVTAISQTTGLFIPAIVVGELAFGAHNSQQKAGNIQRMEDFIAEHVILDCNVQTAYKYGQIKGILKQQGRPIPENDIWIAAIAVQYQLPLVSRDNHFAHITHLNWIKW